MNEPANPRRDTLAASVGHTNDWIDDSPDCEIPDSFGRYRKIRLLGRGGMGAVYLMHDSQLDRQIALKVPARGGVIRAEDKERFLREARAISGLRHPNLCPVYDVGEEDGFLYFTMAFIEGVSLAERSARKPYETAEAIALVRTVALAMHEAHLRGVIHRDLKPANILIDLAGTPVITDFGLARRMGTAEVSHVEPLPNNHRSVVTRVGEILGTPAYMSPEQARGDHVMVGPASDVYSLGVILYELIANRRPFDAANFQDLRDLILSATPPRPSEFYPWIGRKLDDICVRALAKDPSVRFATMAEFERALGEI